MQWNFVHGLFEFAIYGGRVDNPFDMQVLVSYLKQFFDSSVLSPQNKNKRLGPLHVPVSTNRRVCECCGLHVQLMYACAYFPLA